MTVSKSIKTVAVIGAGAAGLVTARELQRAGFTVTVFEASAHSGGLWVYDDSVESDPLGLRVEQRVHSSIYQSLRTNLPRDLMAFSDFSFDSAGGGKDGWLRFPPHHQVRSYLDNFVVHFDLQPLIEFETQVLDVTAVDSQHGVCLSVRGADKQPQERHFDALAVCNGHLAKPRVPQLPNMSCFTGEILHSHNYRKPEPFAGKRVAIFGASASGADLAREIAGQASEVYWCGQPFNQFDGAKISDPELPNLHLYSCPVGVSDDGLIKFNNNENQAVDSFIYATGYHYDYPFLKNSHIVEVDDNYVSPLYQQIIPPNFNHIGFIGIPFMAVPFPMFEIQARWFAQNLLQSLALPSAQKMLQQVKQQEQNFRQEQREKRHFHKLGEAHGAYLNRLLAEMGQPEMPSWFVELLAQCERVRMEKPATYRDEHYQAQGPTVVT